ncbi:MAG: aspartyl protease family protein [Janthinobacterium lividum]
MKTLVCLIALRRAGARLLVLALLLAGARPGYGQEAGLFRLARAGQRRLCLPLQVQRNLPVVQVWLNGAGPYNFLLDTGVASSLLLSQAIADSLHLPHGQDFRVVGTGGKPTGLLAYQSPRVRVGLGRQGQEAVAPSMALLVLNGDSLNLSGYVGLPVHGILGSELFYSFVAAFEGQGTGQGRLVLTPPAAYRPPRAPHWTGLPLAIEGRKAYFTVAVRQVGDSAARPLKLLLDTGASHALSLETTSDPRLHLPAPGLPADLGHGLSGLVRGVLGRVATVDLGRYRLPTVLTSFPNAADVHARTDVFRNGSVGYELLRRFRIVIDYPHRQLWLRRGLAFGEPFEHDMAGFDVLATGPALRRYQVLGVVPGTPAAAAGLQNGDELLAVGILPVELLSLTQLTHLLRSASGTVLHLIVRHPGGELLTASVRLQRRI